MIRLTEKALGLALAIGLAACSPLCAGDDNVCARLFAALGGAGATPPAKKKATDFTQQEIRDILTQRPCLKHFPWPEHEFLVPDGTKKAVSTERMGEIAAGIRSVCTQWVKDRNRLMRKVNGLSEWERRTVGMLQEGTDPENLALFGEFMYVLKLRKDGKNEKIVETVEAIRKHDPLRVEAATMDEFEDSTYYTKPTLRCMITLIDYGAKAETLRDEPGKLLPVLADLLDTWPILQYHTGLAGDPKTRLLALVGRLRPKLVDALQIKGEYWKHTAALENYPGIAGVMTTGDSWVLYLRGPQNGLHALAIAPSGRTTLLTTDAAAKAFTAFTLRELRDYSNPTMRLFRVLPDGDGYVVTFPDGTTANLSRVDYARLMKGEKLPADHPLAAALAVTREESLVLYSHPLMRKAGPELTAAKDVTFALQRAYPEMRIHRDPLSAETVARAKRLNGRALGNLGDILVLVADDSFRVPQNATVKNIQDELTAEGLKPDVFAGQKYAGPTGRAVIVITGHTSAELAKYVRELGEAGYFKDNFVVFNSCESPLTEQLLTEMTSRYGAAAAFAHEKKIGIDEVQQYLLDFVKKVKATGELNLFKLLLETLHRNKLNGVWSICRAGRYVLVAC
jgi:hypothetical protein